MKVKLKKDQLAREIVATGDVVKPGETVEVPDEVGESLCEQVDVWEKSSPPAKASKAADEEKS